MKALAHMKPEMRGHKLKKDYINNETRQLWYNRKCGECGEYTPHLKDSCYFLSWLVSVQGEPTVVGFSNFSREARNTDFLYEIPQSEEHRTGVSCHRTPVFSLRPRDHLLTKVTHYLSSFVLQGRVGTCRKKSSP